MLPEPRLARRRDVAAQRRQLLRYRLGECLLGDSAERRDVRENGLTSEEADGDAALLREIDDSVMEFVNAGGPTNAARGHVFEHEDVRGIASKEPVEMGETLRVLRLRPGMANAPVYRREEALEEREGEAP